MEDTYALLPDGPVICEHCETHGRQKIVMQRIAPTEPEVTPTTAGEGSQLHTYRCPSCERVAVFTVS